MNAKPWERLITPARVHELHLEGIKRYSEGVAQARSGVEDCVEGALGKAWTSAGYEEDEGADPGLSFAAHLIKNLAVDHCYLDGNKRVAWLSAMEVLSELSLTLDATDDEAYEFMMAILSHQMTLGEVVIWISERLVSVH